MREMNLEFVTLHLPDAELRGENVGLTGVSTDTRTLQAGELFVALTGPHFDGHEFVEAAKEAGAAAVMVAREVGIDLPQVVVPDTLKALGDLASAWRCEFSLPVIGITGSTGKTTVKQMLASILGQVGKVLYTRGNLNNEIGVPLTLLRLRDRHEFAVIEMGANHPGEIAGLAALARPGIGLITNAGAAHLEGFGSIEGVVHAKGELYSGVVDGGSCIINGDQPWADEWAEMAGARRIVRFGLEGALDFHVTGIVEDREDIQMFTMQTPSGSAEIRLPLPGRHNVANALAAAATAWAAGASPEHIATGLAAVETIKGRMSRYMLPNDIELVDDSYNANPLSMRAAIDWLVSTGRKGVFVMGDMGELGDDAEAMHADVGDYAAERGVMGFFGVGPLAESACTAFGGDAKSFRDVDSLIDALESILAPGMTVVIKGSRASRMERVVDGLRERRNG